ncbi:MAG: type I secretion system permease/ATPase [Hyphomicrobiales bacterium]
MQPNSPSSNPELKAVYRASRGAFISTGVFSCISNILMLTGPIYMMQVYDRVLASGSVPTLVSLSAIVIGLYAYYGFLEYLRSRILVRVGRRVEEELRGRVFDVVTAHALRRTPGIGAQPINDLNTVRQFLSGQGPFAFFDMPWMPIYLLIIYLMNWMLGVAALAAAAAIFTLALISERVTRGPIAEATKSSIKAAQLSEESRRNSEALHALGMQQTLRKRWADVQGDALHQQTMANDASGLLSACSRVLRLMVQSGMLGLGAYLAIQHDITAGSMIAASIIMSRALAPVELAVSSWQQFLSYRKARDRLAAVLATVPADASPMQLPKPRGKLDVENLVVQLPGVDKPLLQGISFSLAPGEGIGIIGPTGAGKSTLARALAGLIKPNRGHIRLDGATLDQRDPSLLGRAIGYLPQDLQLFDGTAAENISRFDAEADHEKIIAAAKGANVHEMIMRLPDGYNTQLGENGARLSTGQRQRVALARALYGDPPLFVLDEPNSALDAEGEAALDAAIRRCLARGAVVVIVAHRPSALAAIPKMLVLTDGKMAAIGARDEILGKVLARDATKSNVERLAVPARAEGA